MTETASIDDRFLPWKRVKDLTGLSRTTAWRLQKAGDFPLPVAISPGRVGWRESEIAAWSASRTPRGRAPVRRPELRTFAEPRREPEPPPPATAAPAPSDAAQPHARRRHALKPTEQMSLDF